MNEPPAKQHPPDQSTEYSLDRTILANERTFAAWLRTGLAALATGVAIEKFLVEAMPAWGVRSIAMILILFSALAFALAGWRYTHLGIRLGKVDVRMVPASVTTIISGLLVLCSTLAFVSLWFV